MNRISVCIAFFLLFSCYIGVSNIYGQAPKDSTRFLFQIDSAAVFQRADSIGNKNRVFKWIYEAIFINPQPARYEEPQKGNASDSELPVDYKLIVRNVEVKVLNVFGTDVQRPEDSTGRIYENWANAIHINSRTRVIKNQLLFGKGSQIKSYDIRESERLIRNLPFIDDSRIVLQNIGTDSVDIIVYAKDAWSITGGASGDPFQRTGNTGIRDKNFLGLGHQLYLQGELKKDSVSFFSQFAEYQALNINKTFVNSRSRFGFSPRHYELSHAMERGFFTPASPWAGGGGFSMNHNRMGLYNDRQAFIYPVEYWEVFGWSGRSFPFPKWGLSGDRLRIVSSYGFSNRFSRLPDFYNKRRDEFDLIGETGFSYRNYYRDKFLFRIGRTEDVAEGFLAKIQYGIRARADSLYTYTGMELAWGNRVGNGEYLAGYAAIGNWIVPGRTDYNILRLGCLSFTRVREKFGIKWRALAQLQWVSSYNHPDGSQLKLTQDPAVRGFRVGDLVGTQSLSIRSQLMLFPRTYFLGFRMAVFGFLDAGLVNAPSFKRPYGVRSLGTSLQLRNDNLSFQTLVFSLAWMPGLAVWNNQAPASFYSDFTLFDRQQLDRFTFGRPATVSYP